MHTNHGLWLLSVLQLLSRPSHIKQTEAKATLCQIACFEQFHGLFIQESEQSGSTSRKRSNMISRNGEDLAWTKGKHSKDERKSICKSSELRRVRHMWQRQCYVFSKAMSYLSWVLRNYISQTPLQFSWPMWLSSGQQNMDKMSIASRFP